MSFTDSRVPIQKAHMIAFKTGTLTVLRHPSRSDQLTLLVTHEERPQPRAFNLEITEALELLDLVQGEGFVAGEPLNGEATQLRSLRTKAGAAIVACAFEKLPGWIMVGFGCPGSTGAANFDLSPKTRGVIAEVLKRTISEGAAHA